MFNLQFSREEIEILNGALIALPYARVANLIDNINHQLSEQQKPKAVDCNDLVSVPCHE